MNNKPKITVVTICYNAENTIEKTILSVLNQTYENIEYIVVDGASKDGTMKIVNKYHNRISRIISESDKGIYDAMNKGIDNTTGDYCLFMNSGDYFYSNDSVYNAVELFDEDAAVIYGNTEYRYDYGTEIHPPLKLQYVLKGAFCCHQSAFFRTDVIRNYRYDLSFKIVADWALFRTLYINGEKFQYIDTVVASYDNIEGASTSFSMKSYINHKKEKLRCKGLNNNVLISAKLYLGAVFFVIRRRFIIPIIPIGIYKKLKKTWVNLNKNKNR